MTEYPESLGAVVEEVANLSRRLLCSDAGEALPPVASSEFMSGMAFLDLARQAFKRAELWRVHALKN